MTLREFIDWVGTAAGFFPKNRQVVSKQPVDEQLAEARKVTRRAKDRRVIKELEAREYDDS